MDNTVNDIKIRDDKSGNEIEGTEDIFTEESYQFIDIDSKKILDQLFVEEQIQKQDEEYNIFTTELKVNVRSDEEVKEGNNFSLIIVILILMITFYIIYRLLKSIKSDEVQINTD